MDNTDKIPPVVSKEPSGESKTSVAETNETAPPFQSPAVEPPSLNITEPPSPLSTTDPPIYLPTSDLPISLSTTEFPSPLPTTGPLTLPLADPPFPLPTDDESEDAVSTGCGWGRFRFRLLAPFAHVWSFIVLYIVFSFTHAVQGSYPIAVLTTLERRFNLSSVLAGVVVNISVFGYVISIIVVSLFLSKTNKPRLFACCMLLTSVGAFLYFLPHIVIGTGSTDAIAAHAQTKDSYYNVSAASENGIQLCGGIGGGGSLGGGGGTPVGGGSKEVERRTCSAEERQTADEDVSHVVPAVVMLSMADLVHGIAAASIWTVGLVFIDDHTQPQLSAKLIGLMYTVRLISPIVSFAMGGYLLSIHTTLKETELTPKHPQWIGAWWMGFLINAIINFVLCIPMSMLPRNLRPIGGKPSATAAAEDSPENGGTVAERAAQQNEVAKKEDNGKDREDGKEMDHGVDKGKVEDRNGRSAKGKEEVGTEEDYKKEKDEAERDVERKIVVIGEEKMMEDANRSVLPSVTGNESSDEPAKPIDASSIDWKEFPRAMIRLSTNPIYVLTVTAICSDWSVLSFMSFMPKYFEVHFQKTASVANLQGGMIPAMFAAAASYVGGVVTGKIKGKDGGVAGLCRMNFAMSLISVLLLGPALLLSCPDVSYSGHLLTDRLNVTTTCNVDCGCSSDVFDPVCGSNGLLYFSPCHAGCTRLVNSTAAQPTQIHGRLVRSEDCRCVAEPEGEDEDGEDGEGGGAGGGGVVFAGFCDEACASLIPYAITLVAFVITFSMYNAAATTVLLRCIKEEDKSFALGLETLCICFAIFPAPLLYGSVFDASCILRRTTSCTESEGSCLLYDRHSLRLHFHGLTIGLKSISTILYCATYILGRRRRLTSLTTEQRARPTRLKQLNNTRDISS